MGDVVVLRNHVVQELRAGEAVDRLDLWLKWPRTITAGISGRTMTERTSSSKCAIQSRSLRSQPGSQKNAKLCSLGIGRVELQDDQVGLVGHVVCAAVGIVGRVGLAHSTVCELVGRVGKYALPPVEEFRWVAPLRDRVLTRADTRRHCWVSMLQAARPAVTTNLNRPGH